MTKQELETELLVLIGITNLQPTNQDNYDLRKTYETLKRYDLI